MTLLHPGRPKATRPAQVLCSAFEAHRIGADGRPACGTVSTHRMRRLPAGKAAQLVQPCRDAACSVGWPT